MDKARQYAAKGDTRSALIELKNVLQQDGHNPEAHYLLGKIYAENSHFQDAEKELIQARKQGYDLGKVTSLMARVFMSMGDPERVLKEIGPITSAPPEVNAIIYSLRARALLIRKDQNEALQSLERADRYVFDHPEALLVRAGLSASPEEAMVIVNRALDKAPALADAWRMRGQLLREMNKPAEARTALDKAVDLAPTDVDARIARALLLIQNNLLKEAETDLAVAVKQAPARVPVRYLDALLDFQNKEYSNAINKLQTVVQTAPDFLPARALMGVAGLATNQRELAVSHLTYVTHAQPQNVIARKLLADALVQINDVHAAQQLLSDIKVDADARTLALQGDIAMRKSDLSSARKFYEQAAKSAPKDAGILNKLATSLLSSGHEAEAVQVLTQAVDSDSDDAGPLMLLINTLMQSKRHDEARKLADKHVQDLPKEPAAHNLRGIVLANMGDEAGARASFGQALSIKPSFLPAARNLARLDARKGDLRAAKGRINAILRADQKNVGAWLALADFAKGEKDEATFLKALESAKQIDKTSMPVRLRLVQHWLSKKEPDKALNTAMEYSVDNPGREDALALIGMVRWQRGELQEALTVFRNWAQSKPDSSTAQFAKAHAELATGDSNSALISLDRALTLQPGYYEATRAKALILARQGKSLHALGLTRDLREKAPHSPQGILLEAEVQEQLKKYLEAAKLFSRLVEMTGQPAMVLRSARAYTAAGQGAESEKTLQAWLGSHPGDVQVRRELGSLLVARGKYREAANQFEYLVKLDEKDIGALNNLAWAYGELKHPQAIATAERAVKAAPENPAVLDTLGWLQTNHGEARKGVETLRLALAKSAGNPDIGLHLASAYIKAGDRATARLELERLLNSGRPFPRQGEARKLLESLR